MNAHDLAAAQPANPSSTRIAAPGRKGWWRSFAWVPSLYLAMGIPFNTIMGGTAARMYKSLGFPDGKITLALGSVGVAWSLKPLWAAFLDMYRTKKFFVVAMEVALSLLFCAVAMSLPTPGFFQVSIALFWIAAFASSTQDICADGVYLTSLDRSTQARLAGVQGTFWVLGKVFAAGVLISVLDKVRAAEGWSTQRMWSTVLLVCAVSMLLLASYHFLFLPSGSIANRPNTAKQVVGDFIRIGVSFFHKRAFWGMIAFVFLYRLGEGLILMEGQLFLQSDVNKGGLGLSAGQVSTIDAFWGTAASITGGLLGGAFSSWLTLPRALGILGLSLNIPHFTYVYLSQGASAHHGLGYTTIAIAVSIEKFGYGFGFVGNMVYMMQQLAPGRSTMTHYAFATSLMNFMLVPTNMISGPLAEWLGFSTFFLVVMFASIPSAWAAFSAPFPLSVTLDAPSGSGDKGEQSILTPDDPSLLSPEQREVQVRAGRASLFAMLNILTILLVDAKLLGLLREADTELRTRSLYLALLLGNAAAKIFLGVRAFAFAKAAESEAARIGGSVYASNARGAKVATVICGIVTLAVLMLGTKLAFS
jgi:PAT family beta-lactamase induction signal transducer AmpG